MSASGPIEVSRDGAVGIVELARPEKSNCQSMALHRALRDAISGFEQAGAGVRAVLVRARGKHFSAGADLDEVKALQADPARLAEMVTRGHETFRRLEASPLPVVAAAQGLSLAGGLELVLACDVVFAAEDARFGDQHAQYGLVPGWGGSQRLTRIVGLRRAMDLYFSARWIDARTAFAWGLVNYVCAPEKLQQEAFEYCKSLAERSPAGLAMMKRLARQGLEMSPEAGLRLEERLAPGALSHPHVAEGLAAFEARRKPARGRPE
jgi:enoyl-CoA hydratase